MERKRRICFYLATVCLLLGSVIYVFFRPTTLLMFHWADSLGLSGAIGTMRAWVHGVDRHLPIWIVYSLPFALWVSSYLFFIRGIWWRSAFWARHTWFWCIPVIAITAELCQSIRIVPGNFDRVDLLTIVLSITFVFITIDFHQLNKGVKQI